MRFAIIVGATLAAMSFGAAGVNAQGANKAFCSKLADGGTSECAYDTMAQCQDAIKGKAGVGCEKNPKM